MSMIPRWKTGQSPRRSSASLRSPRTRHSTRTARCARCPVAAVGFLKADHRGGYTFRYYEGGVSSVFLWDLDDGGFAGVVLLKKGATCLCYRDGDHPSRRVPGCSPQCVITKRALWLLGLDPRLRGR